MRFLLSKKVVRQSDAEIIFSFKKSGDNFFIGILFDRYSHLAFAVCMNYLKNEDDSKDAVIHIFEKISSDLKKYDVKQFSHWLHTVTKNYCLKELSRKKHAVDLSEAENELAEEFFHSNMDATDMSNLFLANLDEALATLTEEQKKCIDLFYLEEKSYNDIATITGYTFNQVKSYIQNGKRNLKIFLTKIK
jgi:RNA polymerase sigma-70 factor (ECF subfamily)